MGKCIICGKETNDFRCCVREEKGKSYDDFQCEECTIKKVEKERLAYSGKFNNVLMPYLIENEFKVVVTTIDEEGDAIVVEEFPIIKGTTDIMYCVDIIVERMSKAGYYESWVDFHTETYEGVDIEVVDYLCFDLINGEEDEDNSHSFHLSLEGVNGIKLLKTTY